MHIYSFIALTKVRKSTIEYNEQSKLLVRQQGCLFTLKVLSMRALQLIASPAHLCTFPNYLYLKAIVFRTRQKSHLR